MTACRLCGWTFTNLTGREELARLKDHLLAKHGQELTLDQVRESQRPPRPRPDRKPLSGGTDR